MTANKLIDRGSYRMPTVDEVLHELGPAKVYSVIDLKDQYLQVGLDEESQKMTTIVTHRGYYAYRTLQFGISVAPLIFQEIVDTLFGKVSKLSKTI